MRLFEACAKAARARSAKDSTRLALAESEFTSQDRWKLTVESETERKVIRRLSVCDLILCDSFFLSSRLYLNYYAYTTSAGGLGAGEYIAFDALN